MKAEPSLYLYLSDNMGGFNLRTYGAGVRNNKVHILFIHM
jgi:hypothetical protein